MTSERELAIILFIKENLFYFMRDYLPTDPEKVESCWDEFLDELEDSSDSYFTYKKLNDNRVLFGDDQELTINNKDEAIDYSVNLLEKMISIENLKKINDFIVKASSKFIFINKSNYLNSDVIIENKKYKLNFDFVEEGSIPYVMNDGYNTTIIDCFVQKKESYIDSLDQYINICVHYNLSRIQNEINCPQKYNINLIDIKLDFENYENTIIDFITNDSEYLNKKINTKTITVIEDKLKEVKKDICEYL